MRLKHLTGRTLQYAASVAPFHRQTYRIFILPYLPHTNDCTEPGRQVAQDYSLPHILWEHPELAGAHIYRAEDYYGQIIFRVVPIDDQKTEKLH